MIKSYQKVLNRILVTIDIGVIILSLLIAFWLKFSTGFFADEAHLPLTMYVRGLIVFIPLHLLVNYLFELYSPQRGKRFYLELINISKAVTVSILAAMSILFFVKEIHISRVVITLFGVIDVLLMTVERYSLRLFLRAIRKRGFNKKYLLVIGAGSLGADFVRKSKVNTEFGYSILGFVDDDHEKQGRTIEGTPVLGTIDELPTVTQTYDVDEVIIALPLRAYHRLDTVIHTCEAVGVKARIIPDYFDYIPARPKVDDFDGIPLINIRDVPLDDLTNKIIKRSVDVLASFVAFIVLAPVMLLIALGVKITSPGSVLFVQERVGLNRKPFRMYKFRSMKVCSEAEDKGWTTKGDPRRTAFGSFLRRTSLDELPQLYNVLKGDMSIIGPRPERPIYVDKFKEEIPKYMIKHHVRPGITGWAQVNGWRGDTSISERIKCDLYYVENWRFSLDLKIVWLTIIKGFVNKNAY